MGDSFFEEHSYLKRLQPEAYQGFAVVHWSMTISDRKKGWLDMLVHANFREILAHTSFRYRLLFPAYVLMPDHLHLLAMGICESSDQKIAMRYFRKRLNFVLRKEGFELQKQGFDHVLREESRKQKAFETVARYILENPLRKGLVGESENPLDYSFSGCLLPGYPELDICSDDYWEVFWKLYWRLRDSL